MIANISQKIKQTKSTLKMDGIACTNALTTTCRIVWRKNLAHLFKKIVKLVKNDNYKIYINNTTQI